MSEKKEVVTAEIVSDPYDSIIDYECPICGEVHSLEPDAGVIECTCGVDLMCDLVFCL